MNTARVSQAVAALSFERSQDIAKLRGITNGLLTQQPANIAAVHLWRRQSTRQPHDETPKSVWLLRGEGSAFFGDMAYKLGKHHSRGAPCERASKTSVDGNGQRRLAPQALAYGANFDFVVHLRSIAAQGQACL